MDFQTGRCNHKIQNQAKSACYREAVEVLVTLPATTRDVGEHLSHEHAVQKVNNQQALLQVLSSSCEIFE